MEDDLNRHFIFEDVGVSCVAECRLCGIEFVCEPDELRGEECCARLSALKAWVADGP